MSDQIFRKKSLDRISSPEQLNDYIRVANPGIWMILAAVIILLAGVCVWGIFEIPVKLKEEQLESAAFAVDESVYTATIHTGLADGIYKVELVTNRVSPMSFVIN